MVSANEIHTCEKCNSTDIYQDEDSLDTWFSSALWPFSTLGWPDTENEDYKRFYPTNVLVTGYDIITFWVSRMMTQGIYLTGKNPFTDIVIHGIERDSQGRKMSKSLGNGIDPIEIIDKYGTDALRFSLILGISAGNDIRYMPEKLDQAANFANKLWNASKFVLMNLEDAEDLSTIEIDSLQVEDKWIISKITKLMKEIEINIDNYDFGVALDKIYSFIWNEFCDWYIEIVKTRLYDKECETRFAAQYTLNRILKASLKLLHPFMPFITEEIYTKLYDIDESIMISNYSDYHEGFIFENEENFIEELKEIIVEIRNVRATMNVHPSKKSQLLVISKEYKEEIKASENFLIKLGFGKELEILENKDNIPQNSISIIKNNIELYIPSGDLVDIEEERKRLEGEKEKLEAEVLRGEKLLSNPGFVNKAPEKKINEEKEKLAAYKEKLEAVTKRLAEL